MALVLLGNGKQQRAPKRSSKFNKFVIKSRPIFFQKYIVTLIFTKQVMFFKIA